MPRLLVCVYGLQATRAHFLLLHLLSHTFIGPRLMSRRGDSNPRPIYIILNDIKGMSRRIELLAKLTNPSRATYNSDNNEKRIVSQVIMLFTIRPFCSLIFHSSFYFNCKRLIRDSIPGVSPNYVRSSLVYLVFTFGIIFGANVEI